jgi:hypothetical protein
MPDPTGGILTGALTIGGGLLSSGAQSRAAGRAADAQTQAAMMGIQEQREAREELRRLLQPYVEAGTPGLQGMMQFAGLGGPEAEAELIAQQEASPLFQGLLRQGENAILQNASATGGLRGGNVQGALAQFRPELLNQFMQQRYGRLTDLTKIGQQSAAGVGAQGINVANQIGTQFGNIGTAQANAALSRGQAQSSFFQGLPSAVGGILGGLGVKGF